MCDKNVRDELDRILETFAIQVDNPISVSKKVYQPSTYGVNMVIRKYSNQYFIHLFLLPYQNTFSDSKPGCCKNIFVPMRSIQTLRIFYESNTVGRLQKRLQ